MVDGIINNGPKQPTVAELEEQAKSGQPISLMDLAGAIQRERRRNSRSPRPERSPPSSPKSASLSPPEGTRKQRPNGARKRSTHDELYQ